MAEKSFTYDSVDEAASARVAGWLAAALDGPCLIFLHGDLGVGKTAFARGFIRTICGQAMQVPSPSFALVQPYDATLPIWHADLYRLTEPEEIDELGLLEALDDNICLIEWPQNGADVLPEADIHVTLDMAAHGRHITIQADETICAALGKSAQRDAALSAFLSGTPWHDADRLPLAGDASTRRYERLIKARADGHAESAVLMDWQAMPDGPPVYDGKPYSQIAHLAEAMPRFADMVNWLRAIGLAAPTLYACDRAQGFALLQDFGDRHLAAPLADETPERAVFYYEAIENLLHLHAHAPPDFLSAYDGGVQAVEASLFTDWFLPYRGIEIDAAAQKQWHDIWCRLGDELMKTDKVTVLRDYHSVNLIWRDKAQAKQRIGLIDVQDALKGHAAYDVASLVCDARINVSAAHQETMLAHYLDKRFGDNAAARQAFTDAFAIACVQRNLKIAGIFIRLAERDGKPAYLAHLPRIIGYLKTYLDAPVLQPVAAWLAQYAPHALELEHD
ncbi:MAG: tRNA (adenosine(37)-N6)-threonylcarbamoyltransferase complex ATPase subunit type 1 TsaE [Parvibaculales bacterium]